MNNVVLKNEEKIENMIYEIRGKQVMLDSDLATLYQVETKRINEAVRRNSEKFPERFCFKLTDEESNLFWSQFATKKIIILKLVVANIKILVYLRNKVWRCLPLF